MTLDRAYVNCRRCFRLAGEDAMEGRNPERDSDLYAARNDALQAVQDYLYAFEIHCKNLGLDEDMNFRNSRARRLANACKECKFLKPSLADKIKEELGE